MNELPIVEVAAAGWRIQGAFHAGYLHSVTILTPARNTKPAGGPESASAAPIREFRESVLRYLAGEPVDFSWVALDETRVSAAALQVYLRLREVEHGATVTYGELAEAAGLAGGARFVGQCMVANPWPIVVPCHRVLAAGDRLGGFSAPGGQETKRALLSLEGRGAIAGQLALPGL